MENRPSVTSTAFDAPQDGIVSSIELSIDCGNDEQTEMLQSHASQISVDKITGSTACTLAMGFVYCGATGQSSASLVGFETNTFTLPSLP